MRAAIIPVSTLIPVLAMLATAHANAAGAEPEHPSINVNGVAFIATSPDEATWHVSLWTDDKSFATSRTLNDQQTAALTEALTKAGLAATAVTQSAYSQTQRWDQQRDKPNVFVGWRTTREFTICLTDMKNYPAVNDAIATTADAVDGGPDRSLTVDRVDFDVSNPTEVRAKARTNALLAARTKAIAMAAALDCTIGAPLQISESSSSWGYNSNSALTLGGAMAESSPVLSGQTSISAEVNVTFALIPKAAP